MRQNEACKDYQRGLSCDQCLTPCEPFQKCKLHQNNGKCRINVNGNNALHKEIEKSIIHGDREGALIEQLDRAKKLFPEAVVYGIIYFVFKAGQCEEATATNFYSASEKKLNDLLSGKNWKLKEDKIVEVIAMQTNGSGSFCTTAGLGIGMIIHKNQ